ncbi:MAG: hypothetical protein K2K37_13255 [Muribaculaceae bacterium]|nr:hypothetical protein [Muribaculaceae bacterium]
MSFFNDRFPFVRQLDAMQCGPAALLMVCRHHGMSGISLDGINQYCRPTSTGISMKGLSDAARSLGFGTEPGTEAADTHSEGRIQESGIYFPGRGHKLPGC